MYRDDSADPPELVCQVGSTKLRYLTRCLDDVPAMLAQHGDWMDLGSADENKPVRDATLEGWAKHRTTRPVVGTACARATTAGCTMYVPRSSSTSDSWNSSTIPATTAFGPELNPSQE